MHVNDLLKIAVDAGASDLHLKVGSYPMMRVHGTLVPASEERRLEREDTEAMVKQMLSPKQQEKFREKLGHRIKMLRTERDWSLKDLAAATRLSMSQISSIEATYSSITIHTSLDKSYHFDLQRNLQFEELDQIHEFCRHYLGS